MSQTNGAARAAPRSTDATSNTQKSHFVGVFAAEKRILVDPSLVPQSKKLNGPSSTRYTDPLMRAPGPRVPSARLLRTPHAHGQSSHHPCCRVCRRLATHSAHQPDGLRAGAASGGLWL